MPVQKIKRTYRKTKYILYKETLVNFKEQFWSFLGSFVGIGILAYIQSIHFEGNDAVYLIGSFWCFERIGLWYYPKSIFTTQKPRWRVFNFSNSWCYRS